MDLTSRIRSALRSIAAEDETLGVDQLAPLDQFHTRGILATADLAAAARLEPSSRVLDLGCGIGGPARYLASTFGCQVTGVDLSPGFIDAANYLTARCGLSGRANFQVADALHLPFEDASFDVAFLQHVAMNIFDRASLYAEVRRILAPGGRFATYDVVLRDGDVVYPTPWARDASTSFLLTEADMRKAHRTSRVPDTSLARRYSDRTRMVSTSDGWLCAERTQPRCRDGSAVSGHDRQSGAQSRRKPARRAVRCSDPQLS